MSIVGYVRPAFWWIMFLRKKTASFDMLQIKKKTDLNILTDEMSFVDAYMFTQKYSNFGKRQLTA